MRIRFCSCELLQASCINSAPTGDSSKSLLVNAPDIIRAYQHTARSMRDYDLGDLPQQCYLNAIKIVDTLQPILEDIETNERTINRWLLYRTLQLQRSRVWSTHGVAWYTNHTEDCHRTGLLWIASAHSRRMCQILAWPEVIVCQSDVVTSIAFSVDTITLANITRRSSTKW